MKAHLLPFIIATALVPGAAGPAFAQAEAQARKQARASRVASGAIALDGRLDDRAWADASPITDFVQAEPAEGEPPIDGMEVRFLYDNESLWIGARMESTRGLQAPLSRRDDGEQSEYLQIEVDTFLDRRTAYMFGVTASGVRLDHYHPSDDQDDADDQFDPVWEARTSRDANGWTAEMRVPFSQLRFNDQPERVFGLNIKRWRPNLNEETYWVVVGRTASGWASRFGDLRGIEGVRAARRLELLPYVSSSTRMTGNRDRGNPFDDGLNLAARTGLDMKIGLSSSLTLEATVNPDFGQVEADPAEVNLTVFETILSERRPFFIEGSRVLEAGTANYYYSRRIGARPGVDAQGEYIDYPSTSTILAAAKLTGRFQSGTSIGFLGAVTDEETARTFSGSLFSDVKVAPRSAWGVARVIQEFGREGSTVGAHLTVVDRDLPRQDALASLLVRRAVTAGVDTRIRFGDRAYEGAFNVGVTYLEGEPAAIERVQRASGHFLQRLDQPRVRLDPTRESFSGAQIQGSFNKIAGRHWLWGGNLQIETPEFHPLDFGRLNYAGDFNGGPRLTYRETQPGRYLRAYSLGISLNNYWHFDRDLGVRYNIGTTNSFTLRNFWVATLNATRFLRGLDPQLTRGGPSMGTPLGWSVHAALQNPTGSSRAWNGSVDFRSNEFGERTWEFGASLEAQPSPAFQVSFAPTYLNETATSASFNGAVNRQYLSTLAGGRPETYGLRYVFGYVDRTTLSTQVRVNITFKPDVTLDVYAEPFAASGRYNGFGELANARGRDLRRYGTDGTTLDRLDDGSYRVTDGASEFALPNRDFNIRSFRSNVVLRWEWRPGSTLFVVWQQNRSSTESTGDHVGIGDLFGSFSAAGDNVVALKTTWWFSR
ncbi:MAG: DUF5916 domain-containing protein [Vicinamibacterales bacterium]